jgi:hypothetical protein
MCCGTLRVGSIGVDGRIHWHDERGRVSAFGASKNGCIPSEAWLRENEESVTRFVGIY